MTVTLQCALLIIDCFPVSFAIHPLSCLWQNMPLQDPQWERRKKFISANGLESTSHRARSIQRAFHVCRITSDGLLFLVLLISVCRRAKTKERKKNFIVDRASVRNARQAGFQRPRTPPSTKKKSGLLSLAQRPESSGFSAISFFPQRQKGTRILHMHINAMPPLKGIPPRPLPVFPAMLSCARPPHPWQLLSPLPALHLSRIPAEPPYLHTGTLVNLVRRALAGSCRPAAKRRSAS